MALVITNGDAGAIIVSVEVASNFTTSLLPIAMPLRSVVLFSTPAHETSIKLVSFLMPFALSFNALPRIWNQLHYCRRWYKEF